MKKKNTFQTKMDFLSDTVKANRKWHMMFAVQKRKNY